MMRKYLIWFLAGPLIVALAIFGWNYMRNKSLSREATSKQPQNDNLAYLPPEENTAKDEQTLAREELTRAINRFRESKSFKVTMVQPTSGGKVTGRLEYIKPLRLSAELDLPDKTKMGLIIIGETAYIRTGDDTWEMTDHAYAKQFGRDFFTTMLISEKGLGSFGIAEDAAIQKKFDNLKRCTKYKTIYKGEEDKDYDIEFCLTEKGEFASVAMQTKEGEIKSEYKDFNGLFLIERPRLPLLQPRNPLESVTTTVSE